MDRRKLIACGLASAGAAAAGLSPKGEAPKQESRQFIEHWIVPHGGDCCGCIVSEDAGTDEYRLACNECGQQVGVMVSEVTYSRMAEALMHAQHALAFAHGHMAHDGKPEHSYDLDFSKELRFIDEALRAAGVEPKVLDPLK